MSKKLTFYPPSRTGAKLVGLIHQSNTLEEWQKLSCYKVAYQLGEKFPDPEAKLEKRQTFDLVRDLTKEILAQPLKKGYAYCLKGTEVDYLELEEEDAAMILKDHELVIVVGFIAFIAITIGGHNVDQKKFLRELVEEMVDNFPEDSVLNYSETVQYWVSQAKGFISVIIASLKKVSDMIDNNESTFHSIVMARP